MSAISKKKDKPKQLQMLGQSPDEILARKRAIESRVEGSSSSDSSSGPSEDGDAQPVTGLAAEKAVGALCFLPKSIHRLAARAADDRDQTAKRFFLEAMLIGLEQMGVITHDQHTETLKLPNEYGWKGRKS